MDVSIRTPHLSICFDGESASGRPCSMRSIGLDVKLRTDLSVGDEIMFKDPFDRLILLSVAVLVLSGVVTLTFPSWLVALYGVRLTPGGVVLTRSFGAAYLGLAVMAWYVLHQGRSELHMPLSYSMIVCFGLGFLIFLISQISGVFNPLGWFDVVLNGLLTAGHIYFALTNSGSSK